MAVCNHHIISLLYVENGNVSTKLIGHTWLVLADTSQSVAERTGLGVCEGDDTSLWDRGRWEKALQESSAIVLQSKSFISQVPNGHRDFCDYS